MGKVVLPCGKYAKTSYRFVNPDMMVHSVEELCYLLKENAFLLDRDIMDKKLVAWLDNQCGLGELSSMLYPLLHQKGSVSAFVLTILEYTGLYPEETLKEVEELLRQGAKLNVYEKYKSRIDHMVGRGQLVEAMGEYDSLLDKLPQGEVELRAKILHNKGVAVNGLFLFRQGADLFSQSYQLVPAEETYLEYLAAMRLALSDSEYISFVASLPEAYEPSLELERRVQGYMTGWENHIDKQRLDQRMEWREEGDNNLYYEETEKMIQGLKSAYRFNIGE